jgi:hypothetical protein
MDRAAGIVSSHVGECVRKPRPNQWQTMTIEYWNDEILAHLDDKTFVLGQHPIIDRTRRYFAFQFDLPGASVDKVRVWEATAQRDDWPKTRKALTKIQAKRPPVTRNPAESYKLEYTNLKSRLTLGDATYRDLVAKREDLKAALQDDYADAFKTHKELSKSIAERKKKLKANDPNFKTMETAVHQASRAEGAYVLSTQPELADFPKNRYPSELAQVRAGLEAKGDKQLAALIAETAKRQVALEARFPEAFASVDGLVDNRRATRQALNDDPEFSGRNRAIVDTSKAIKAYEDKALPELPQLAADSKTYLDQLK